MYTLILLAMMGGSPRPVSVVVPNLDYQECTNQIRTISSNVNVVSATCALQSEKGK